MTTQDTGTSATGRAGELFQDDFTAGLRHGRPDAPWGVRRVGDLPHGDAVVTTDATGLVVTPSATDPATGLPRFTGGPDDVGHLRWAALVNHTSGAGFPGFDARPGGLALSGELAVRGYQLDAAGPRGTDPHRDPMVAAAALITLDRETGLVFDFMLTDRAVHAVYERIGPPDTGHALFSYSVPVAEREPDRFHRCVIEYTGDAVTWWLDGARVLDVDRLGTRRLDPEYLTRDNDRPERPARPRQLTVGLGLFAERPLGQGVRLAARGVSVTRPAGTAPLGLNRKA